MLRVKGVEKHKSTAGPDGVREPRPHHSNAIQRPTEVPGFSRLRRVDRLCQCIGAVKTRIEGNPDPKHVSTSYAERNNLNVRMHPRRLTRLTNGFSKKVENHAHAMALHFMYYNFVRIRKTLRTTPAMAAGVTDRLWEMKDVIDMLEAWEATQKGA
jgi:hypothetical protein